MNKELIQSKISELQSLLDQQETAYDYEKVFDKKWQEIGSTVFQESFGEVSRDRNKKNDTQ